MAYLPSKVTKFPPGMKGNALGWARVLSNHGEVYDLYRPTIVQAGGSEADPLVTFPPVLTFWTVLRFVIPRDLDDVPVAIEILWKDVTGTAEIQATCGTDTDSDGVPTVGAYQTTILWVSPADATAGAAPILGREVTIQVRDVSGSTNTVEILSIVAYVEPSLVPSGVQPSGWISVPLLADNANEAIPSERVARLISGPALIAQDRPACVVSMVQDTDAAVRDGGRYKATSTTWMTVGRYIVPGAGGHPPVRYGVAVYLVSTGSDDVECQVTITGQAALTFSGDGWHYATFTHPNPSNTLTGEVRLRSSDGSRAALSTLQIFRLGPEVT